MEQPAIHYQVVSRLCVTQNLIHYGYLLYSDSTLDCAEHMPLTKYILPFLFLDEEEREGGGM